jgi:sulfide:quinone oxidoreductase
VSAHTDALRVVVAGGGVAALEATLALRALAREPVSVELIAPETEFVYRPLAVTEPFRVGETRRFPLESLVEAAGGTLQHGRVTAVDPDTRVVRTDDGTERPYDAFLVALGARSRDAVPGALTFTGPDSRADLVELLEQTVLGGIRRIVFALPAGAAWPLPLYELALLTKSFLVDHGTVDVELVLVTPEERPLILFGAKASDAIAELLAIRGIECRVQTTPVEFAGGVLRVAAGEDVAADRVVALPRLEGPRLEGLPADADGFLPVNAFCRVGSEVDVYAAGDATQFPLKQGGIAAQQADVAATEIAVRVGSTVEPTPFKPVLRGLLMTGMTARFLRAEPGTAASEIDTEPLWWPPAKIVGRHLAPFLAAQLGLSDEVPSSLAETGVPVEVELDPDDHRLGWRLA